MLNYVKIMYVKILIDHHHWLVFSCLWVLHFLNFLIHFLWINFYRADIFCEKELIPSVWIEKKNHENSTFVIGTTGKLFENLVFSHIWDENSLEKFASFLWGPWKIMFSALSPWEIPPNSYARKMKYTLLILICYFRSNSIFFFFHYFNIIILFS